MFLHCCFCFLWFGFTFPGSTWGACRGSLLASLGNSSRSPGVSEEGILGDCPHTSDKADQMYSSEVQPQCVLKELPLGPWVSLCCRVKGAFLGKLHGTEWAHLPFSPAVIFVAITSRQITWARGQEVRTIYPCSGKGTANVFMAKWGGPAEETDICFEGGG